MRGGESVRHKLGQIVEGLVAEVLRRVGHTILARNYRCLHGEIDIVSLYGEVVYFWEVKARLSKRVYFFPVKGAQRRRLRRCARIFLARKPALVEYKIRFVAYIVYLEFYFIKSRIVQI